MTSFKSDPPPALRVDPLECRLQQACAALTVNSSHSLFVSENHENREREW
jgi:hypothetical protein